MGIKIPRVRDIVKDPKLEYLINPTAVLANTQEGMVIGAGLAGGAAAGGAGAGAGASGTGGSMAGSSFGWGDAAALGMGAANYFGQKETNAQNLDIAREQMQFQAHMSNTAHQREVTDLKAAGLNPLLSAKGGASSPSGASAVMGNAIGAGIASAQEMKQLQMAADMQRSQKGLINAQTENTKMDTIVKSKGLPEAEAKNMIWDSIKGIGNKVNQAFTSGANAKSKSDAHSRRRELIQQNNRKLNPHKGLR